MIPFFRKIRKKLADQNQFLKYSRYAIGEIALVVIGILIALQINNWNENRLLKKEELKTLKSLNSEFVKNLKLFDDTYEFDNKSNDRLIQLMSDYQNLSIEELDSLFNWSQVHATFDPSNGMYNTTINSGKIELISNHDLKLKIASFQDLVEDYKENDIEINKMRIYWMNYMIHDMEYKPLNWYRIRNEKQALKDKETFHKIIESESFQSLVTIHNSSYLFKDFDAKNLREELVSIIDLLNLEITKLDNQ